jgi:hypothetical protein
VGRQDGRLLATNRDSTRRSRSRMTRNAPDATSVSTYSSLAPQVGQAGVGGCCWSRATEFVSAPLARVSVIIAPSCSRCCVTPSASC